MLDRIGRRADREPHLCELSQFVDRMQQPGTIGAELLPRDRDDPPQHFFQLERSGKRFEDVGEEPVALLGAEVLRPRPAVEITDHQPPYRPVIAIGVAIRLRQLEDAGRRLLPLQFIAKALPRFAAADGDERECLPIEKIEGLLLRTGHNRREAERSGNVGESFCRRLGGHNQDLVQHGRRRTESTADATTKKRALRMMQMPKRSFDELVQLMQRLRGPDGCPWDRKQTLPSLKPFVIEESYEVVDAIDRDDRAALAEELGDFLLQAVFIAELTREEGSFDIYDAVTAIHDKLVHRHPHVFGDVVANDAEAVLVNWEKQKNEGRKAENKSVLSGVPQSLPALLRASRLTEKAARVGFDWRHTEDVFDKVIEEIDELHEAIASGDETKVHDEVGDLLFTIANIARKLNVNAEEALQSTNRKFTRRFGSMESHVRESGRNVDDLTLEELDALWDEAKAAER